jgi:hypothetical protein
MLCAFAGPIPGNNASTSAGAVFKFTAPSTAFAARASRPPTKIVKATRPTSARTAIVVVGGPNRLRGFRYGTLGAQTFAAALAV